MKLLNCLAALMLLSAVPGVAETTPTQRLTVELNKVERSDGACTLTFLVQNDLAAPISALVVETVLFDAQGEVRQFTLFDFGALPQRLPRVRQFAVDDTDCTDIGQVLLNGLHRCEADTLTPEQCAGAMTVRSRTDIEVLG